MKHRSLQTVHLKIKLDFIADDSIVFVTITLAHQEKKTRVMNI